VEAGTQAASSWRGALEEAAAGARPLPGGYILKPRESLGQPVGLDRIFVERCRAAFSNLNRMLSQGVIAVASPHRNEGRTSVAAGLALALAHDTERQVLLADLDLRHPGQGSLFDVPDGPGLSDYIEQDAVLRLVGGGPGRRLWLLTAGTTEPAQVVRLVHQLADGEFFTGCRQAFPWTVLDLPPLLETPEAAYLAGLADACLLVGRYRRTSIHALSRASALIPAERPTGFLMTANSSRVPSWINRLL